MKTYQFASVLIFLILGGTHALGQSKSNISGIWFNTEKTAQIEIMEMENGIIGKIVWIQNANNPDEEKDIVNSDSSLRDRPLMGLTILEGLKYKDGMWSDGKIYDPESGLTYTCELNLKKKDLLEVTGYLGDSWVSRTVEWNRVRK